MARQTTSSTLNQDVRKRRCVILKLASVNEENGKLRYDWDEIRRAWDLWPNASLTEFCVHYDLIYRVVMNRGTFHASEKRQLLENGNIRYRTLVVGQAAIPSFEDESQDVENLRSVIRDLRQTAALGAKFAKAKMAKLTPDGQITPNTSVPIRDVRQVIEIAAKCTETIQGLINLRDLLDKDAKGGEQLILKPVRMTSAPRPPLKLAGGKAG